MASNTSSISITKIAAATIPEGVSASSEQGMKLAERVVGKPGLALEVVRNPVHSHFIGLHFFNPVPVMVYFIPVLMFELREPTKVFPETRGADRCPANLTINTRKSKSLRYRLREG
jgi:hypothetical protein